MQILAKANPILYLVGEISQYFRTEKALNQWSTESPSKMSYVLWKRSWIQRASNKLSLVICFQFNVKPRTEQDATEQKQEMDHC